MCLRASSPPTVSTTWPRTSDQSYASSAEWISTVMRGSRRRLRARCRCGSVFTRMCSPSVSTQVSSACGWPPGIKVTTVARFLPLARRTVSSSSGMTCRPPRRMGAWSRRAGPPASVSVDGDDHSAGDGVEAQVEPGDGGGDVGVDALGGQAWQVQRVYREYVPVRLTLRRRGPAEGLD